MANPGYKGQNIYFLTVVALFIVLHTVLYFPVYLRLVQAWGSMPQCSHGYFVLPIIAWLCFMKHKSLQSNHVQPSYRGCIMTYAGLFVYVAALAYESDTFAYLSYMISIAGLIVSFFGLQLFKLFIFPYLFLFFMFPIPSSVYLRLTGSMKLLASTLSAGIISSFGIPVLRDGNIIQLSNLQLSVVEACSGMQSLVSYIMLGSLLAYHMKSSSWKKLTLIAVTIPVALLNNIMRITSTGIIGQHYGIEAITGTIHDVIGMFIFVIGLMILISVYHWLVHLNKNSCVAS
ncbi:exosortase/archaeosortase family protein [Geotalea daltonii]|nr:exosortase/archaeosortase family protein [Geotalea daltonii]